MKLVPSVREALEAFVSATVPAVHPTPAPSLEALAEAEAALGHRLPASFVAFMREAGARHAEFWETFWVGPSILGWRELVAANLALRASPHVLLPPYFIAFAPDGSGGYHVFDTRHTGPEGEYPVRHWEHEVSAEENSAPIAGRYHYFPEWLLEEAANFAT